MAEELPEAADVRQWEIWQVYWKHEDGTGKERPALAVSTSAQNAATGTVRFVKITGQDHPEVPGRLQISSTDAHFPHTGLNTTSWIHLFDDQIVAASELRHKRGSVSALTAAYAAMRLSPRSP